MKFQLVKGRNREHITIYYIL